MRRKLLELKERLKSLRTKGGRAMTDYLRLHLLGYQQYYGVSGNSGPLRAYTRAGEGTAANVGRVWSCTSLAGVG